jgi:hypothetical protein
MGHPSNPPRSASPGSDRGDGDGNGNGDDGANQSGPHASADNLHPDVASVLSSGRIGGTNDNHHRQQDNPGSIGDRRAPPARAAAAAAAAARAPSQQQQQHPPHPSNAPPPPPPSQVLRVQFGSSLHQTYTANPISYREVIVAPALLGHENNSTNFADLREDFTRIVRQGRNESPKWTLNKLLRPSTVTMLAEASSGDGRPMNGAYRQSTAVMHVVRRACAYYSVDEPSAHVHVSYRKGQPPCLYAAHANARCVTGEADEAATRHILTVAHLSTVLYFWLTRLSLAPPSTIHFELYMLRNHRGGGHNMTIVASFGAARAMAFVTHGASAGARSGNNNTAAAPAPAVGVNLSLANNTVVGMGRGVFAAPPSGGGGWEYGIRNLKPCVPGGRGTVDDDSITVMIHGRCTAMEQLPNSNNSSNNINNGNSNNPNNNNNTNNNRPKRRRSNNG